MGLWHGRTDGLPHPPTLNELAGWLLPALVCRCSGQLLLLRRDNARHRIPIAMNATASAVRGHCVWIGQGTVIECIYRDVLLGYLHYM